MGETDMGEDAFDLLAEAYDAMIDWDKRLAREGAFLRKVFEAVEAKRVLDAACGTGRHAAMFASWGLEVQGADSSSPMIDFCRSAYADRPGMSFVVRPFDQPADVLFDAVVCIGNSLSLVDGMAAVDHAMSAMLQSVRPGGVVVVQVLNLLCREEGPITWDKQLRARLSAGETMILKGTHRAAGRGYVHFVLVPLGDSQARVVSRSVPFLQLRASEIAEVAVRNGCRKVDFLGGYDGRAFDPHGSGDLICVCGV